MKKHFVLTMTILSAFVSQVFLDAADAQGYANNSKGGYRIDRSQLQRADWNKSRMEVQLLDMTPIVKDFRGGQQEDSYTINLGPAAQIPGRNYVINAPGSGGQGQGMQDGGGRPVGGPGFVTISGLPRSGFEANAPFAKPIGAMRNLPNGKSTNLLAGSNAGVTGQLMTKAATRPRLTGSNARPGSVAPVAVMSYNNGDCRNAGGSVERYGSTQTSVVGLLRSRLKRVQ